MINSVCTTGVNVCLTGKCVHYSPKYSYYQLPKGNDKNKCCSINNIVHTLFSFFEKSFDIYELIIEKERKKERKKEGTCSSRYYSAHTLGVCNGY